MKTSDNVAIGARLLKTFFMALRGNPSPGLLAILMSTITLSCGCAIRYYDRNSGTEHLWGFGHLKMRAVPQKDDTPPFTNDPVAYVTEVRTLGLSFGLGEDFRGIAAGWDTHSRVVIKPEGATFYLMWPENTAHLPWGKKDLFSVRIGTNFPEELPTKSGR